MSQVTGCEFHVTFSLLMKIKPFKMKDNSIGSSLLTHLQFKFELCSSYMITVVYEMILMGSCVIICPS